MQLVEQRGSVADLHARDPLASPVTEPQLWVCDPTDAAIVLGSRQGVELLDRERCRSAGLAVATRRSGGGLVLVRPDDLVWIDAVLPVGAIPDDVRASMVVVGDCWAAALRTLGCEPVAVHRGGMVTTEWSELVCFAGTGPGEVLVDGRKLVGLSQRRSRRGIRVQGLVHRRELVTEIPDLLAGPSPSCPPQIPATIPGLVAADLVAALAVELDARLVAS